MEKSPEKLIFLFVAASRPVSSSITRTGKVPVFPEEEIIIN